LPFKAGQKDQETPSQSIVGYSGVLVIPSYREAEIRRMMVPNSLQDSISVEESWVCGTYLSSQQVQKV
jgi:hypothetical protein